MEIWGFDQEKERLEEILDWLRRKGVGILFGWRIGAWEMEIDSRGKRRCEYCVDEGN